MLKKDVIIIGSGPAGYTAALYLTRAGVDHLLIKGPQPGGQLTITTEVENYPGFASIQGPELMKKMDEHVRKYGTETVEDKIEQVNFSKSPFLLWGKDDPDEKYSAKSVIICTGASAKWLGLESEKEYQGYGVSGCATCDGFFFKNKIVAVVGGGNTALTEALHLTHHAKKVFILHRGDKFRAEQVLIDKVMKEEKIQILWKTQVLDVIGERVGFSKAVTAALINEPEKGIRNLKIDGLFIAIGHKPNTDMFKGQLEMDSEGYIITKPGTTLTSIPGIFACGDVQDKIYRQAITSAGSGCMAAIDAQKYLSFS
jgi:thioredoxin reductase (NADPH)